MSERSGGRERSEQSGASERVSGASERANGRASGPVLTSRFLADLNHSAAVLVSFLFLLCFYFFLNFFISLFLISVNKARLVLTRTLQLALSWNSPTFSYFFIFLTFFFTNEEKTKNPPGALETRDVALQDDHKKERKRRVQHRYPLLNENLILNFKTGRENSICI